VENQNKWEERPEDEGQKEEEGFFRMMKKRIMKPD
jgi:hypothetical protein